MRVIRTPDQRLRVFVSSTLQEMAPERLAARDAVEHLRLVPVMFELGARPHPPADLYRAYLAQSDIFVGLYWKRYGWVAPGMEVSGLEDEWRLADGHPKLVYIKEADDREPELVAMLDRIRDDNSTSYRSFTTADELRELLQNDLAVLLSERFEATREEPEVRRRLQVDPSHRVPNPPTTLIGREPELRELDELLRRDDTRLVTISGAGGSGKTRLAIEVARRFADEGWTVAFADLTGLRSSALVLPTIAARLGVKDAGDRSLVEALATVLAGERVLLVVDNFEHVIDAATDLADVLSVTDGVKMIVTSRQPLHLRWEHDFPLLPLPVPDAAQQRSVDAIAASPAVELIVDRIRRVRPVFRLTPENAPAIAEITRRLDGLPLALELAAARLRVLQPGDLLARLERRLPTLEGTSPDLPDRHRTLRATISWSHDHLTDEEQRVFRRLGVFAGGAGLEAAAVVCGGDLDEMRVLDVVESLVDKSLLVSELDEHNDAGTRIRLLETVREFAVERLVAAGEAEATWDRHLEWHCEFAENAWRGFWTGSMATWLDTVEREQDNLRTALDHAAGAGDAVHGLRIGAALRPFWDVLGHYREGERRLRELLALAPEEAPLERGRALMALGWMVALMGDFETAMALMDDGVPLVRAHGNEEQLAWALSDQGNVAFSLGLTERAEALFGESLQLAQQVADVFLIGLGLFGQAYVALLHGDLDAMLDLLSRSLELSREMIQPWGIAWVQFSVGVVRIMQGRTEEAVGPVTESLVQRSTIRDTRGLAESTQLLATLASQHGELEWSALLHGSAELQRDANGLTILPFLRPLHDESVARLRAAMAPDELERAWRRGRGIPIDKLVHEAEQRAPVVDLTTVDADSIV